MKTLKLLAFLVLTSFFANAQTIYNISALVLTNNYQNAVPNYPVIVIDSASGAFGSVSIFNFTTDANGQVSDSLITFNSSGTLWFLAPDSCGFTTIAIGYTPTSPSTLATAGLVLCNNLINFTANCNYTVSALPVAGIPNQAFFNYSGATGTTYLWDFGDGNTSNQANALHTYAQPGTYYYCLQIDTCPPVCDSVTVFGGGGGCDPFFVPVVNGSTVNIYPALLAGQFQVTINWGDGTSNTYTPLTIPVLPNNISHTYSSPGNYQICLTHSNTQLGCSNTQCNTVSVNSGSALCNAEFIIDTVNSFAGSVFIWNTSTFSVAATTVTTFLWNFGDGFTSTQPFPVHSYSNPGMYNVCLSIFSYDIATQDSCMSSFCDSLGVDANGNIIYKGASGWTLNVLDPSSIGVEEDALSDFKSFPNPVKDVLQLSVPQNIEGEVAISLYSISGVAVKKMSAGNLERTIDMSNLPSGMYLLQVEYAGQLKTIKVIKQN